MKAVTLARTPTSASTPSPIRRSRSRPTRSCGSPPADLRLDLHLYEVLTPFMNPGDVLGHELMGVVEEVGLEVSA